MLSLEAFSELLEVLYSVPLRQERWSHFLDLLCKHTGSLSGFLICANSRVGLSIQEQGGKLWDQTVIRSYAANYAFEDPYKMALVKARRTGIVECSELIPYEQFWDSPMYRHLNEPAGVKYPGLMVMTMSLKRLEAISLWRTEDEGPMNAEAHRLLALLLPHVRAAMDIRYALGVVESRAQGAEAMVDASRTATFLLSSTGEVLHRNAATTALLDQGDGLTVSDGCLTAVQATMRVPLRKLLRAAAEAAGPRSSSGAGVALSLERRAGRSPLHLLASPITYPHSSQVLLLVSDPDKPVDVTDAMMRAYFGLTPAETEIINGLLTGYSLEEIAALRQVTLGTTRAQMKSIFAKAGVMRQAELMRKLTSLPSMA